MKTNKWAVAAFLLLFTILSGCKSPSTNNKDIEVVKGCRLPGSKPKWNEICTLPSGATIESYLPSDADTLRLKKRRFVSKDNTYYLVTLDNTPIATSAESKNPEELLYGFGPLYDSLSACPDNPTIFGSGVYGIDKEGTRVYGSWGKDAWEGDSLGFGFGPAVNSLRSILRI